MTRMKTSAIAAIWMIVTVTGCSSTSPAKSSASVAVPNTPQSSAGNFAAPPPKPVPINPAAVDMTNPEAVGEAVATSSVQWDTTADTSDLDGVRRVLLLLTPPLAATMAPVEHPSPGPEWAKARDMGAYSVPKVYTAEDAHDPPPDTATTVHRAYTATWTWYAPTGAKFTDRRTRTMYLTISQQPDGRWLVSTFDYNDL